MGTVDSMSVVLPRIFLTLLAVFVFAATPAICRGEYFLVWGDEVYDEEDLEVLLSDDRIFMEDEGTYTVPFHVSKSVYVEAPEEEAPFGAQGKLYRLNGDSTRTHISDVGTPLVYSWEWDTEGEYEVDIFKRDPPILTQETLFTRIVRVVRGDVAHADTDQFHQYITTIRFKITEGGSAQAFSSVAFFPGVQSSSLYRDGFLSEDQLWVPNVIAGADDDLSHLYMNESGKSIEDGIYTKENDIILNAYGRVPVYEGFPEEMDGLVSQNLIKEWKAIAYDWRLDIPEILEGGEKDDDGHISYLEAVDAPYIIEELRRLAEESHTGKVSIIAHSNGGLLAKELLVYLEEEGDPLLEKIDLLVLVAVPQLGTPKTLFPMLHGAENPLTSPYIRLNDKTWRRAARFSPGAYNLLPSKEYFERADDDLGPLILFDTSLDELKDTIARRSAGYSGSTLPPVFDYRTAYGKDIVGAEEFREFLSGEEGRMDPRHEDINHPAVLSTSLIAQSQNLHDRIDSWMPPDLDDDGEVDIKVVQIVGTGLGTIKGVQYITKKHLYACRGLVASPCTYLSGVQAVPLFTTEGDETVVVASASAMPVETYYVDLQTYNKNRPRESFDRNHANIMGMQPVGELIQAFIQHSPVGNIRYVSETVDSPEDLAVIEMHSPADVHIYDKKNNHTGLTNDSDAYVEVEIPNSTYLEVGESAFFTLDPSLDYRVKLDGRGSGTFTLKTHLYEEDKLENTVAFVNVPVTATLVASSTLKEGEISNLAMDTNGDGKWDKTIRSERIKVNPHTLIQELKAIITPLNINTSVKKTLLKHIEVTEALILQKKNKLLIEIQVKLIETLIKTTKSGMIPKKDAEKIGDVIFKLIGYFR